MDEIELLIKITPAELSNICSGLNILLEEHHMASVKPVHDRLRAELDAYKQLVREEK